MVYDDPSKPWLGRYEAAEAAPAGGAQGVEAPYPCSGDTSGSVQLTSAARPKQEALSGGGGQLVVTVRHFADGSSRGSVTRTGGSGGGEAWSDKDEGLRDRLNVRRSARRARNQLIDTARTIEARRMLTFTFAGDHTPDGVEAKRLVLEWWRDYGVELGLPEGVVTSAEQGGRHKRLHVHAGCGDFGWVDYRRIYGSWSRFLTARGYHHPMGHRVHVGEGNGYAERFSSGRDCGFYLAKYVGKAFEAGTRRKGEHHYSASEAAALGPAAIYRGVGSFWDALRDIGMRDLGDFLDLYIVTDKDAGGAVRCVLFDLEPPWSEGG